MVFIATTIPPDELKETKDKKKIVDDKQLFMMWTDVETKYVEKSNSLQHAQSLLWWCSFFYDFNKIKLYLYLMSDKHYYTTSLYNGTFHETLMFLNHPKAPAYVEEAMSNPEKYPRVKNFTEEDFWTALSKFGNYNFNKNGIVILEFNEKTLK